MTTIEILFTLGGIAGILGGLTAFARYVADNATEARIKRFESTLRRSEAEHQSSLRRLEAEYAARLARMEEQHRASEQYAMSVDLDLRKSRSASYAELWIQTEKIPKWPKNVALTYAEFILVSAALRDWYFGSGGILLSRSAQGAYRTAQTTITTAISTRAHGKLDTKNYDLVQDALSSLRSELTDDFLTRHDAPKLPSQSAA